MTGIAGLVAGALSMAAGEYSSVQSQADTESADLNREQREELHFGGALAMGGTALVGNLIGTSL